MIAGAGKIRPSSDHISTLNEKHLHAALKAWYAQDGDRLEVRVEGYLVDVVRGDLLIEIQTRGFGAIRRKLAKLAAAHPVRLVHAIPQEKWIIRQSNAGVVLGRRRSPKHGSFEDVFVELVGIPNLIENANFSLELLLIREEEVRRHDSTRRGWRRKGWVTHERRLLDVVSRRVFETPKDLAALIPAALPEPFTTAGLASALGKPRWLAQKMAYCLRAMGALDVAGKRGNAVLYARPSRTAP